MSKSDGASRLIVKTPSGYIYAGGDHAVTVARVPACLLLVRSIVPFTSFAVWQPAVNLSRRLFTWFGQC